MARLTRWTPTTTRLEERIAEEELKLAEAREIKPTTQGRDYIDSMIAEGITPRLWGEQPRFEPQRPTAEVERWMPRITPETMTPSMERPEAFAPTMAREKWLPSLRPEVAPTPWYKTALEKISEPFEWVKEHLEEPWAAAITAPFSPALAARPGETWLEREKREYKLWEAPKFVKGAAELSMPLWWLPYFGWAAKGAGVIPRIGGSLAKGIVSAEKAIALPVTLPLRVAGKGVAKIIKLPPFQKMREEVFKADRFRWLAAKLAVLPGMKSAIGVINPSAVASGLAQEGRVLYGGLREYGNTAVNAMMAQLERHGTSPQINKMFGLDDMMRSATIKPKVKGAPTNWWDIASNPNAYHLEKAQRAFIDDYHKLIDDTVRYAETEFGIKIPKKEFLEGMHYIPRVWQGRQGILDTRDGIWRPLGASFEPEKWQRILEFPVPKKPRYVVGEIPFRGGMARGIGAKGFWERPRYYEFAEEALAAGLRPGKVGAMETMNIFLQGMYRKMIDTTVAEALKPLGKTIKQLTPLAIREEVAFSANYVRMAKYTESALQRAIRGEKLPTQTINAIGKIFPNVAKRLEHKVAPKMGIVGSKAYKYDIEMIEAEIAQINKFLKTPGKLMRGLGRREELQARLAMLEAQRTIASFIPEALGRPEALPDYIRWIGGQIGNELGNRSLPYHGGVPDIFTGYTTPQLDSMIKVYDDFLRAVNAGEAKIGQIGRAEIPPVKAELRQLVGAVKGFEPLAKARYQAARTERTKAYEMARRTPGWRAVGQPFAAGRLFPEAIANDLNKMMTDRGMKIFTKMSDVNALSRFLVTGFDFGAGLIQGIPLAMSNPIKWGRAMGLSMKAFADPLVRARYLSRPENIAVMEKMIPEGLLIGNSEFMESASRGLLSSRPVEVIDKLNVIQRFAGSFNTFGDVARIEWAKGLLPMVERQGKPLRDLAAFINEATGVMSSRALGVGATQREIEGAVLLFAPRYFRANMSFWTDMTRGGLRGELARDTLASMMMGGFFWYYGLCKALGQEPNFNPSTGKFMTVEIGNQHIGLGSMQVAMFRLLGNIARTTMEDPKGFITLDSRDNPLIRFARSRVAPLTGSSWDILTGKSFIGEPLDTPKSFSENVLADRLLPFWLSSYVSDYPKPGWAGMPTEMFGARTWPLQLWERQNELREQLAQAEYGKPWFSTKTEKGINELQKAQLEEKYDDLRRATEATMAQRLERGGAKEQMWHAFQEDRGRARSLYDSKLWAAQDLFDKGEISGYDFRQLAKTAGAGLRGAYKSIEGNPAYEEVMEFLSQPMTEEQMRDTPIEDIAFDIYMSLMYSGDLEDAAGQYNFEERDRREQIFVAQFGEGMLEYIKQRLSQGRDTPPLMQEYYKAQEALKPYWGLRNQYVSSFGEPRTPYQEQRMNEFLSRYRKRYRALDPTIRHYYDLFYSR